MPIYSSIIQGLKNLYIDFGSTPTYTINATYNASGDMWALGYDIYTLNNTQYVTPKRIDSNGNIITSGFSWMRPSGTTNDVFVPFKRQVTGVGVQQDWMYAYFQQTQDTNGPSIPVQTLDEQYVANISYLTLQQAVSVTKFTDASNNTVILANNSSLNIVTGTTYKFDKTLNRGDEASSVWGIYKTDPAGSFQQQIAVAGTDYNLVTGNLNSDVIEIQFLTSYNFEVHNECAGYTFSNNPFATYSDTTTNRSVLTHYFVTTESIYYYEITFPRITTTFTVPTDVLVDDVPFTTYQGQQITVNSTLDLTTASWIRKTTDSSVPDITITKSDSEWRTEILNRCNVTLEVRNSASNILLLSQNGLGPYSIVVNDVNSYTAQFKLVLK